MGTKERCQVSGYVPGIGHINDRVWAYNEQQAKGLALRALEGNPAYNKTNAPSLVLRVKKVPRPLIL